MGRRRRHARGRPRARRGWVLGLSVCAALLAASIALAPILVGADPGPTDLSFVNRAEGGGIDHANAHIRSSAQAARRAAALVRRCSDAAWRSRHPAFCPAPAPTPAQARLAAVQGRVEAAGITSQPDGQWGPLLNIPSTAIHAVLLPTGKVLWFSQPKFPTEQETDGGNAHLWDPATNTTRSVPPPVVSYPSGPPRPANLWCGGQTLLPDGRVLVVGGNLEYPVNNGVGAGNGFKGGKWVMTFDPWTETWTKYADMAHGRWYPTLTELADGRVLIVGGWDETGGLAGATSTDPAQMVNNKDIEVFDPSTPPGGQATTKVMQLPAWRSGLGLYPHQFLLPDTTALGAGGGKVLIAGPLAWDSSVLDTTTWTWTDLDPHYPSPPLSSDRSWGTAYFAPSGPDGARKVVLLGGSNTATSAPGDPGTGTPPLASAEVLDLNAPSTGWQIDPALALNTGRAHFNTVLLPDGSILTNGGGFGRSSGSLYAGPIYAAELLTPGSGWRQIGAEADARTYHSTSLLLPDGRVVSAGDDRDILPSPVPPGSPPGTPPGHIALASRTAQVYSPPYLFGGPRPAVTFSPKEVRYNAPFRVAIAGTPAAITRAVLMRPGAVTHAVDMSQQMIELNVTAQADGLTMTSPRNASVAPPGYYMLYVLNAAGVPSVASWLRLDPAAPDAPALPVPPSPPVGPTPPVAPPRTAPRPPRLRVASARAALRGRTMTVRLRVTSSARATVTARLVRARGEHGRVVTGRATRRLVRAARPVSLVLRARAAGALPRRLRAQLWAVDARGNRSPLRTVVVRVPAPRPRT